MSNSLSNKINTLECIVVVSSQANDLESQFSKLPRNTFISTWNHQPPIQAIQLLPLQSIQSSTPLAHAMHAGMKERLNPDKDNGPMHAALTSSLNNYYQPSMKYLIFRLTQIHI